MAVGQQVWICGPKGMFEGQVQEIHPVNGILVAFNHGGGAWMTASELRRNPEPDYDTLRQFKPLEVNV